MNGIKSKGFLLTVLFFIILLQMNVFANENLKVFLNGVDTNIEVKNVDAYIPLNKITEMLECVIEYNTVTGEVYTVSDSLEIKFKIGAKKANVNGIEILLEKEPFIDSENIMIPLDFIIKAVDGYIPKIKNKDGLIEIYTKHPVWLINKMGKVAAKHYYYYEELNEWQDFSKYVEYEVIIPYFSNMVNEGAVEKLNKSFQTDFAAIRTFLLKELKQLKVSAESERYTVTEYRSFNVVSQYNNIVSLLYTGYNYYGGAHGMPFINGVNLDLSNPYIMPLGDLFINNSNYKEILLKKINEEIKNNQEAYYVEKIDSLPSANSFYIYGDMLIVYYDPYVIAPYAAGFPAFEFPLSELSELLKDEFKPAKKQ